MVFFSSLGSRALTPTTATLRPSPVSHSPVLIPFAKRILVTTVVTSPMRTMTTVVAATVPTASVKLKCRQRTQLCLEKKREEVPCNSAANEVKHWLVDPVVSCIIIIPCTMLDASRCMYIASYCIYS